MTAGPGFLTNIPALDLRLRNVSSETSEDTIRRLVEEEAVSVFLGSGSVTSLLVGGEEVEAGASVQVTARAYLHTINTTSLSPHQLHILPVLKNDSRSVGLLEELELQSGLYPRLSLLPGLVHSPTLYTRSDTQDLAAAIIRQCVLVTSCELLVLSLDHLDLLLQSVAGTSLAHSRWWVVEVGQYGDSIREMMRHLAQPSILSLAYVGDKEEQFIMERFLSYQDPVRGSVYEEWSAYNTVVRLHRVLAQLTANRQDWTDRNIAEAFKMREDRRDRFVMMTFKNKETEVVTVPDINWLVLGVLEVSDMDLMYEDVRTMSLTREEMERMYESVKAECPEPEFVVVVTGRGVTPGSEVRYSLSSLPEVLILPVSGEVVLTISCPATTTFTCRQETPARPGGEDLSCVLEVEDRRPRRDLREEAGAIQDSVVEVVEAWQQLTPSVIGCYSSLAGNTVPTLPISLQLSGCDFCFYFFGSYNLSVSPGVCSPGCLMGTVSSCATILTQVMLQ